MSYHTLKTVLMLFNAAVSIYELITPPLLGATWNMQEKGISGII